MKLEDMILVSIDDHVIEPAGLFERHMPARYKDQAPKLVTGDDGKEYWHFLGTPTGTAGLNAVASWPHEEWGMDPAGFAEMRPGCYDADARVRDMDANGVLASMCFPTFPGFNGMNLARAGAADPELATAVVAAYNDWHIDELAGDHPGRFIPLAITPVFDPQAAAAEIRRVAEKGCTAVSLPETPYGVGLPAYSNREHWDPVFKALQDCDVAMCLHIGGAFGILQRPEGALIDHLIILAPQLSAVTATDLITAGIFREYPDLKVAMSEGGIGWIPFFLDRLDRHVENHRWTGLQLGADGLDATALFRKHFLGCFITDPSALHNRHRIGIDSIAWECDFPHSDSTWPRSPERLMEELEGAGCTDEEIHKIGWENASRFFRWDPFQHTTREDATVGALRSRATDVDTEETSREEYRRRYEAAAAGV